MIKTRFVKPYTINKYGQKFTTFPQRNKSGVYFIKEKGAIVYIGFSRTDLYKTMYRHFQQWTHREQEVITYAGNNLDDYTIRVIYCTPKQAEAAEKYLIKKYKPRDNTYKYEDLELTTYDKNTGRLVQETQTAKDYEWKPDPKDMVRDYSDYYTDLQNDTAPF